MIGFEAGRCPNCQAAVILTRGGKYYVLDILKHVKECPSLKKEEREIVIETTLALLDLLSSHQKS